MCMNQVEKCMNVATVHCLCMNQVFALIEITLVCVVTQVVQVIS